MARPETAMEPSMDEILASIRKIIAEEPAGNARPKPAADRPAPVAMERAPTSQQDPSSSPREDQVSAPLRVREDMFAPRRDEPKAAAGNQQRDYSAMAVPAPRPMPQRDDSAFGKPNPFTAPAATQREPQSQSTPAPAAAPASSPERMDTPADRPTPTTSSTDTDVLFGRLAEALRSGIPASQPANPPAGAPANKQPTAKSTIASDLDDLDDLLAEPVAQEHAGSRSADRDDTQANSPATLDFGVIFPRDDQTTTQAARERETAGLPRKAAQSTGIEARPKSDAASARTVVDAEIADLLSDDEPVAAEGRAAVRSGVAKAQFALKEFEVIVDLDDLDADAQSDASAATAQTSEIEPEFDDPEGDEAAKSAFGALMAGLAASSSSALDDETATSEGFEKTAPRHTAEVEPKFPVSVAKTDGNSEVAAKFARMSAALGTRDTAKAEENLAEKMPKVVAASLPLSGIATAAKSMSLEQADFAAASSSPGPSAAPTVLSPADSPLATSAVQSNLAHGKEESAPASVMTAASAQPVTTSSQVAAAVGLAATLASPAGTVVGVRTVEDIVAELLRPMLREWLAENMPRMVEKALRIELAEGLKTVNQVPPAKTKP